MLHQHWLNVSKNKCLFEGIAISTKKRLLESKYLCGTELMDYVNDRVILNITLVMTNLNELILIRYDQKLHYVHYLIIKRILSEFCSPIMNLKYYWIRW